MSQSQLWISIKCVGYDMSLSECVKSALNLPAYLRCNNCGQQIRFFCVDIMINHVDQLGALGT